MPLPHEFLVTLFVAALAGSPAAQPAATPPVPELVVLPAQDLQMEAPQPLAVKPPLHAAPDKPASQSVGLANDGELRNGKLVEESELIRFKAGTPERERYATDELAELLEAAAGHVAKAHPGAALTVGDLSQEGGGELFPHASHRNGRDADVVFYALSSDGSPAQPDRLVAYRRNGRGRAFGGGRYVFDDVRNWKLVAFLLDNEIADVDWIFIASSLEQRLLDEGRRQGADPELLSRAARLMKQSGGDHDDHFHLRIRCSETDRPLCRDR